MPDQAAVEMVAKSGRPAFSTTSDMPVPFQQSEGVVPENGDATAGDKSQDQEAAAQAEKQDEPAASTDGSDTAAKPDKAKPPKGVQKRIDELTREKREAERKASEEAQKRADLERQIAERQRAELQSVQTDDRPERSDYEDPDAYTVALSEWTARKAVQEDRIQRAQAEQQARVQQGYRSVIDRWQSGIEKALEKHPDFREVTEAENLPIAEHLKFALLSHDNGHEIAYYLGTHPDEAARLSSLSPLQSALAVGALGAKLADEAKPQVSRAPRPATPIAARSNAVKTPESESMEEYAARRTAELRKARA